MKKVLFFLVLTFPVILFAQVATPPVAVPSPAAVVATVGTVVQTAPPAWAPPDWAISILNTVQSWPTVGPYIVKAVSFLALVSVAMTILATFFMGLLKALSKSTELLAVFPWLSKLGPVSDKIDAVYEKVVPYLQFFSMYNSKLKLPVISSSSSSGDSKST